jgi:ubiquinone/menaquinone biosynthesis C-methylase UbiE
MSGYLSPILTRFLMQAFGRPRGVVGRIGGAIMARLNRDANRWVVGLLKIRPGERVLEVGCGPGTGLGEALAHGAGFVFGIDPSREMLDQAGQRNAAALADRRLDLRCAAASGLPVDDGIFDAAFAVNSLQLWPDAVAGLRACLSKQFQRVTPLP